VCAYLVKGNSAAAESFLSALRSLCLVVAKYRRYCFPHFSHRDIEVWIDVVQMGVSQEDLHSF